jgi:hypothetical protein
MAVPIHGISISNQRFWPVGRGTEGEGLDSSMKAAVADWKKKEENPSPNVYAGDVLTRSHVMCYSHPSLNQSATVLLFSYYK